MNLKEFTTLYGSITSELTLKGSVASNFGSEPLQGEVRLVLPGYTSDGTRLMTWIQDN